MTRLRSSLARKGNRIAVLASFISYLTLSSGLPVIPVAEAVVPPSTPSCSTSSSFDSFTDGSVNGQGGWKSTGPFDQAVVDNTYGYSSFGCKSLRISNAVTSGGFGNQTFAAPTADTAGESTIASNNHFDAQFDIAATQPGVETGLTLSVSPDDGNGSRMSYLSFTDEPDGIHVGFYDVTDSGPIGTVANFNETDLPTLSRATPHIVRFSIDFVDGPGNDVVNIYIDGSLVHTGTTWEDYYRFDPEQAGNGNKLFPIDTLIFRAGGTAAPSTSSKGFLFDNFSLASINLPIDTSIIQFVNSPKYVRENNGGDLDAQIVAPTTATAVNFYVDGSSTPIAGTNIGGATATTDWWRLYTPLPAGAHTVTAKVDIANTWYDASNTGTVYSLDLPTASYIIPQAGQYFRPNDKVVRVKADDEFDQFNYMKTTINGVTTQVNRADCSDQGNYVLCDLQNLNLPEGTYTADTTTYTKANNRYDHLISDPFTIDGTKPSVTSLTIENETGGVVAGTADVAAEATDNDGVESVNFYMTLPRASDGQCTGNGTQLTSQRITTPDGDGKYRASLDVSSLSDGDYCVTAVARDNAWNNSSPVNQKVTVHNIVPAHNIRFTKYECLSGTSVTRAVNGPDGSGNVTVPANCWTESGAEFGYIYQAGKTDYSSPYTGYGDGTPYTSAGLTDASGTVLVSGLSTGGRYDVAVLNGDGTYSQTKAGLSAFFCAGTDTGDGTNNYEIAFAPANGTTYCVAYDTIDPQCTPSNADTAGYWRLDELTAGLTAVDSTGSNDGTPHNNPMPSMSVPSGLSFGDPRSLSFDGTQYVDLGNSLSNTTNFTVSAWVNPSSLAADRQIISKGYNGTDTQWELKTSTNDGKVSFRSWNGSAVGVQSVHPLVANQWTHVVGSYDGTTWKIYLNGVLDNSAVAGAPVATTRDLVIGGV
ncbi:MAG TPA: LamG domain-containing protein, partial [Candidatus Peribacteraceae bacterium]|nr:LamG domain-containing protein [Candidatus Peribacteraceae bacterium]